MSCKAFLQRLGHWYVSWVTDRLWLYILWLQDAPRFEPAAATIGEQMNASHREMARALASMPDFRATDEDAVLALRILFGTLFYSTMLESRMGLAPLPTGDALVPRLAATIAQRLTASPA